MEDLKNKEIRQDDDYNVVHLGKNLEVQQKISAQAQLRPLLKAENGKVYYYHKTGEDEEQQAIYDYEEIVAGNISIDPGPNPTFNSVTTSKIKGNLDETGYSGSLEISSGEGGGYVSISSQGTPGSYVNILGGSGQLHLGGADDNYPGATLESSGGKISISREDTDDYSHINIESSSAVRDKDISYGSIQLKSLANDRNGYHKIEMNGGAPLSISSPNGINISPINHSLIINGDVDLVDFPSINLNGNTGSSNIAITAKDGKLEVEDSDGETISIIGINCDDQSPDSAAANKGYVDDSFDLINEKIDTRASYLNQLLGENQIITLIQERMSGFSIGKYRGTVNSEDDLPRPTTEPFNEGDYAYVQGTEVSRYEWIDSDWDHRFTLRLNFTPEQRAAIDSGITSSLVNSFSSGIESLTYRTDNIDSSVTNLITEVGLHDRQIGELVTSVDTLSQHYADLTDAVENQDERLIELENQAGKMERKSVSNQSITVNLSDATTMVINRSSSLSQITSTLPIITSSGGYNHIFGISFQVLVEGFTYGHASNLYHICWATPEGNEPEFKSGYLYEILYRYTGMTDKDSKAILIAAVREVKL